MHEPRLKGKSHDIPKRLVWDAWLKVKDNGGAAGVDGVTIEQFEEDLSGNLFRLWNRMSSGSVPSGPIRAVEIPKKGKKGGIRVLGIPNIIDRVAQAAAAMEVEPNVEPVFHEDSYGYRPGRAPVDAVAVCRERCFKKDWAVDLDIRAFFDCVSWALLLRAVARHSDQKWVVLYVERWLKAPMQKPDGTLASRVKGTPQGSPISPVLANLFLHYAVDAWMVREFPTISFERFADDAMIHCVSERQARHVRDAVARRLVEVGLELHPDKTRIVYCKDSNRRGTYEQVSFTFCGYTFRPRKAYNKRTGEVFAGLPTGGLSGQADGDEPPGLLLADPSARECDPQRSRSAGSIRCCGVGSHTSPRSIRPRCARSAIASTAIWCDGRGGSTSGWSAATSGHEHGCRASEHGSPSCSCTGGTAALRPASWTARAV